MDIPIAPPSRPSVTLVVPNFNHAQYLSESLGSIAAQTRVPDRVLVIDDASTDDSIAVIWRFIGEHPTWRLVQHSANAGVVAGQNEAIRTSDTEWIGFLGADDALHPEYLEKLITQAARFPDAGLICACTEIIGPTQARALRPVLLPASRSCYLGPHDVRKSLRQGDNYFSGVVSLYRRSALVALGGFDEQLGSFADAFLARQLALTFGVYFVAEILGYWRVHGQNYSLTTATDPKALAEKLALVRGLIAQCNMFPDGYAELFERRTRFGAARIALAADGKSSAKAEHAAALLDLGQAERWWLTQLLSLGDLGRLAALAWATLRTRPMSLSRLISQLPRRQSIIAARAAYRSTMTQLSSLSRIRHRLNCLEASFVAPAPPKKVPPLQTPSASKAHLTTLAFRLYGFLSARRQKLLPFTTRASTLVDRYVLSGRLGPTWLRLVDSQLAKGSFIAPIAAKLSELALVLAAQIHLSASRKPAALRAVRLLNLIFRTRIRRRSGLASSAYFGTLALCDAYDRIVLEAPREEALDSFAINFAIGVAHMYRGNYSAALHFLGAAAVGGDSNALRKLGCVHALMKDYDKAAMCFAASVERDPRTVMAHQNYAAGYDSSTYKPSAWELQNAGELLIYDNLIQLGENFYHQGHFEDTFRCYQAALDHQDTLAQRWHVPQELIARITAACRNFRPELPIRLLGYEWVTLIGHIGFIDCHLRMADLGLLPQANYVLLAPPHKVVNRAFLSLLAPHLCIVEDPALVDALLPYQRLIGDQFIAVRGNGALAEPWAHAAARAQVAWKEAKRPPIIAIDESLRAHGRALLSQTGATADWFVALHIREGGYHGDGPGTTRQHRSADVGDYLGAISEITKRGGAVVRLGDKSMTPLKELSGVFDYAHSGIKSAEMDLFLCAEARLFIGTTSGLTSAVQALGTPMLLINCISNDCQFWHDETDFVLRLIYDQRAKRYLSLHETYQQPLQAHLIDTGLLTRSGLEIHANHARDIAAAVAYKLDCLDGKAHRLHEGDSLLKRYRAALTDNPYNFGMALPVPTFLESYPELLDTQLKSERENTRMFVQFPPERPYSPSA
jgi:putative glycosyltransferase (TIGR04372 family)